ncbi:hypothetical protein OAL32_01920 [Synechococcus sp. AH-551-G15]|nr:hypothetical protein [Synechococcus sp. AH-551-G15]
MEIRDNFNPKYSSSNDVKVVVGKKKDGSDKTETIKEKKLFLRHLFDVSTDERFRDILCALAIPYVFNGLETVQYTQLGSGNGGYLPTQKTMDFPYWNAVLASEEKHFESTIFGVPHSDVLVPDVNLSHLDPSGNWADQQQHGIGHVSSTPDSVLWNGKKVKWGSDPVLTLLMVEGMTFFRGRLATTSAHTTMIKGADFNEANQKENYVKTIPFTVKNNSISFTTGTWGEQSNVKGGMKEIWAPQWQEPLSYRSLLMEIRKYSEVIQSNQTTIYDSKDMMMFLSESGRDNGVTVFHRYLMAPRQGQGNTMVVPLEKFDCQNDIRVDVLTSLLPALRDIRQVLNNENTGTPNSVLNNFEILNREVESFMTGGSSTTKISLAFVRLIRHLRVSLIEREKVSTKTPKRLDRRYYPTVLQPNGKNEVIRFGNPIFDKAADRFSFNEKWISAVVEENNSPEVRLALTKAHETPLSTLHDISEYLEGMLDNELVEDLTMMFQMCRLPQDIKFGVTKGPTPWMPMDYVVGCLLHQSKSSDSNADQSDKDTWNNLIAFSRPDDAMATGIQRLRLRHTLRSFMEPCSVTDTSLLMESVNIPLCHTDVERLIQFIN